MGDNIFARWDKSISLKDGPAKKRKLNLALHRQYAVPMSFLHEAMNNPNFPFSETEGGTFGVEEEGFVRKCYLDLKDRVVSEVGALVNEYDEALPRLVEIRGSSGVGKSAFMAYIMAVLRKKGMQSAAIFHATKSATQGSDKMDTLVVKGSIWLSGKLAAENQRLDQIYDCLEEAMPSLQAIFMDGCSMTFSLEKFSGIVIVAASPSMYTRNLRQAILRNVVLYMPPWSVEEGRQLARILDVNENTVQENFVYMEGIVRYMLSSGLAKKAVVEAVDLVNPKSLVNMLSTQMTDKTQESIAVQSLVRWCPEWGADGRFLYDERPSFEMVSRFAEKLVAEKLATLETQELESSWRTLQPLSGAEGYAGALFEAYAVRRFIAGGTFAYTSLKNRETTSVVVPPLSQPEVVECNTLSQSTVPLEKVWRKVSDGNGWQPTILWPTTTNFPTFDAFYFHSDGQVYALQMTISTDHPLKNGGAFQASKYFSAIDSATPPYPAVFVVPESLKAGYKMQKFTGNVLDGKKMVMAESDATKEMGALFEQCIIGL